MFPQPTLTLLRYRAGPLESSAAPVASVAPQQQQMQPQQQQQQQHAHRPRLAATLLRQELIAGAQTRLSVAPAGQQADLQDRLLGEPTLMSATGRALAPTAARHSIEFQPQQQQELQQQQPQHAAFEISSWALVDEASLSSNVVTQFECVLAIEGANYEQRQSLALQRGK